HAMAGAMLRLLGLGLTATLMLGVAVVFMDLTAWQWGPTHLPTWTGFPGWPLAAGMLVCVAVLAILYSFGRRLSGANTPADHTDGRSPRAPRASADTRTTDPYGSGHSEDPESTQLDVCAPDDPPTELGREVFFVGDTDAPALRKFHLATGLALIAMLGVAAMKTGKGPSTVAFWVFWIAVALITALALIVTFLGDPEKTVTVQMDGWFARMRRKWHAVVPGVSTGLVAAAALELVASIWLVGQRPVVAGRLGIGLPGVDGAAFWDLWVCTIAIVLLFLSTAVLAAQTRTHGIDAPPAPYQRFAMGMTAALAAAVGTFLAVGYAAAMSFGWAWFLERGAGPEYEITPLLQRIAYAWGLTFLLLAVMLIAAAIVYAGRRSEFLYRARAAFTFGPEHKSQQRLRLPSNWIARVARTMWLARLKNYIEIVFWSFAVFGIVLSLAAGLEFIWSREDRPFDLPGPLGALSEDMSVGGATLVITLGSLVLIGLAVGLVFLGRGAIRQEAARRGVNVAWDVIAFWPRAAHPFVPPPYSQRAVADLRSRISWHLGTPTPVPQGSEQAPARPATHVVVAAHSQGSLIALAALLWLPVEERGRVGLVTFGSQLKVQFPRAFPAYVNFSVLLWLYEKFDQRWISLYRDTDAIAGPVLSWGHTPDRLDGTPQSYRITQRDQRYPDEIDVRTGRRICGSEWRLLDPTPYDLAMQEGAIAKIRGHSNYPDDPDYPAALRAVFPRVEPPSEGPRHGSDETARIDTTATTPVPVRRTRTQRAPSTAVPDEAGARPQAPS
ncbi:MAG: hypothetical protein M3400_00850, partial [Actinomycetota bacterium]|nr:hypothetical protein [Actinomycetota bacterium]